MIVGKKYEEKAREEPVRADNRPKKRKPWKCWEVKGTWIV
jgi:hypothetical protein